MKFINYLLLQLALGGKSNKGPVAVKNKKQDVKGLAEIAEEQYSIKDTPEDILTKAIFLSSADGFSWTKISQKERFYYVARAKKIILHS